MDDERIMWAVRDGEVSRLELLFDRHHRSLYRYFLHLTLNRAAADDLVQEVFFRILKYRATYQAGMPFRAWMFQVARNVYLDQAGRHREEAVLPDGELECCSQDLPPDRQVQKRQETAMLHRALAAMPGERREVLIMSRFLEWKYDQIAAALKCEVGTVKVRVYRAMRDLSERFFALSKETS